MQKDIKTRKMTRRSSFLHKTLELTIPEGWDKLTQDQQLRMIELLCLYKDSADWQNKVRIAAVMYFTSLSFERQVAGGWVCTKDGYTVLIKDSDLPAIFEATDWLLHPEDMRCRIESFGPYQAHRFDLRGLKFGKFLELDNYFAGYIQTKDRASLEQMTRILYHIDDKEKVVFSETILLATFLWFSAAKKMLGDWFPKFLKPQPSNEEEGEELSQFEKMQLQIRLLTKGDVTKVQAVLDADTWDAFSELDAQAKEAEELRKLRHKKK